MLGDAVGKVGRRGVMAHSLLKPSQEGQLLILQGAQCLREAVRQDCFYTPGSISVSVESLSVP